MAFVVKQSFQPTLETTDAGLFTDLVIILVRGRLPVVPHLAAHGETSVAGHIGELYHVGLDQVQMVDEIVVWNGQVQGLVGIQAHPQVRLVAVDVPFVKKVGDARAVEVSREIGVHIVHRHVAHFHALAVGLEGGGNLFFPLGCMVEKYLRGLHHAAAVDYFHGCAAPLLVVVHVLDVEACRDGIALNSMT